LQAAPPSTGPSAQAQAQPPLPVPAVICAPTPGWRSSSTRQDGTAIRLQQQRELAALACLDHPGLVALHDGGTEPGPDGRTYVVTDLVEGPTLRRACSRDRCRSVTSARWPCRWRVRWPTSTRVASCTATSSPPTSCSSTAGNRAWPTSGSPVPWTARWLPRPVRCRARPPTWRRAGARRGRRAAGGRQRPRPRPD
jgi:hypothetical protein